MGQVLTLWNSLGSLLLVLACYKYYILHLPPERTGDETVEGYVGVGRGHHLEDLLIEVSLRVILYMINKL